MRKHWILYCFLLLSLVPLSCSQKECEWRHIAKFANCEVENFDDFVISDNIGQTAPFSVHEKRLSISYAHSPSDVEASSDNMALVQWAGSLTIDLYHCPNMKFVKTVVDDIWAYDIWTGDGIHGVTSGPFIMPIRVNVKKGLYCLFVSSSHVHWAVTVSECG